VIKIKYKSLTKDQLLKIAHDVGSHDKELNKEWHKRFGMNFPYKLDKKGKIYNALLDITIWDEEADALILDQAKRLRERRKRESKRTDKQNQILGN